MADSPSETIVIGCGCGAKMRVPATAAGKKAKCAKCGGVVAIPATVASAPASPVSVAPEKAHATGGLDDLLNMEQAFGAAPVAQPQRCPQCKVLMATGATVCISCGYNVATGKTLTRPNGSPGKVAVAAKMLGTFALGTVLSAVGAAVGGLAWFLAAHFANLEVGYIAWGIGVLAGVGMRLGYREFETKAGVVAAGMAFLSIFVAKYIMFSMALSTEVSKYQPPKDGIQAQREFVAGLMVDEILDERDAATDEKRFITHETAMDEARSRVHKMSDDEVRAACDEYRDYLKNQVTGIHKGLLKSFIRYAFGAFDLLWFFLALGSAYKIGLGATVKET